MSKEEWRNIAGYEGLYQVSSKGRVRSRYSGKWKVLKLTQNKKGYKQIMLYKGKKYKTYKVHRLVADAFLKRHEGQTQVNHRDRRVFNNTVENLEWCTSVTNANHKLQKEYKVYNRLYGEKYFKNQSNFCDKWGLSKGCLNLVLNGKRAHHKGWILLGDC